MTIKLNLSAKTYKADFGKEFGIFTIRPMGAGEELELSQMASEMEAMSKELAKIDTTKAPEDYTDEERKVIDDTITAVQAKKIRTIEILKGVFSSDTEGKVDDLFNKLDVATIRGAYDEVVANG